MDEVIGSVLRPHSRIYESDQIGECMVAEKQIHTSVCILVAMNRIEPLRPIRIQITISVAREIYPQTPSQNAFVGRYPLHSKPMRNRQYLFGNAALRRPHPLRPQPKHFFVQ